ncbi:hypothetical protein [Terribacillus saccharophilus]|uniref:hypothetical protein n=1 Tax=Terribacillus saccharophilus TaxID=361277 RepID=UPI000C99FB5D|nr:hypothetical protein [Terribacillus goriensis]
MLANINVDLNQEQIKAYIDKKLDENIHQAFLFVDINRLEELTTFSRSFLENEILSDDRMKLIERRKSRKRVWLYQEALKVIQEISDEW